MSKAIRKTLLTLLLLLCVGIQCAEASGYWDSSFQDTGDELSVVAIALCVGVAVSVAATLVARVRAARAMSDARRARVTLTSPDNSVSTTGIPSLRPPLPLRI